MIPNINKLVEVLEKVPSSVISEEMKGKILESAKILYEFNEFLCVKYNISPADAEKSVKDYLSERAKECKNINLKISIGWVVDFAKSEGFDKHESLENELDKFFEVLGALRIIM